MNLIISNQNISQHNGLFSLNDLHKVSGGEKRHEPNRFLRNQETKELIAEIESENQIAYHTVLGKGKNQGTYVCRELVYRYAMWISAKFSLMVIRAFDVLNTGVIDCLPRLTSEQTLALRDAVNMATGVLKLDYSTIYKMIHQRFNVGHIKELSLEQLEQAVEYVHRLMCGSNMNEQEANYNAQWRLIGLLEYDRVSKELHQLQENLGKLSQELYRINRTKGLIYDAISQQQIHATDDYKQRLVEAQAFIAKQHESKKVFFGE